MAQVHGDVSSQILQVRSNTTNPGFCISLHRVIVLVDISVGLMDSDKMLIEMLTEQHKPFLIVLTKADKVKDKEITA